MAKADITKLRIAKGAHSLLQLAGKGEADGKRIPLPTRLKKLAVTPTGASPNSPHLLRGIAECERRDARNVSSASEVAANRLGCVRNNRHGEAAHFILPSTQLLLIASP